MCFSKKDESLSVIRGLRIVDTMIGDNATTIRFTNGWGIAIFNEYIFKWNKTVLESSAISKLKGLILNNAYISDNKIWLSFQSSYSLEVILEDQAFHGPEAVEIFGPQGEEIIIP